MCVVPPGAEWTFSDLHLGRWTVDWPCPTLPPHFDVWNYFGQLVNVNYIKDTSPLLQKLQDARYRCGWSTLSDKMVKFLLLFVLWVYNPFVIYTHESSCI